MDTNVIFVVETFKKQRDVTEVSQEQAENQRFNDMFFELLHLYQEVTKSLGDTIISSNKTDDNPIEKISFEGKEFFDIFKTQFQKDFIPQKSFEKNRLLANLFYMSFYSKNKVKLGSYFRTLYRIYDLIENSKVKETVKKDYLKIVRAQLTESELFFLRYNCTTYYGRKFIKYVNRYNVLKHLPTFEMLEFKDWWKGLDNEERIGLNILFANSRKVIRKLISENKSRAFPFGKQYDKYLIEIKSDNARKIDVSIQINQNNTNKHLEYSGFEKMTNKKIQALLDCYLKEIFLYSTFGEVNALSELCFYSDKIETTHDITKIHSGVKIKTDRSLRLFDFREINN